MSDAWLAAGRQLTRLDWCSRHGLDAAGRWAEIEVKGVVQRLRWLPPGEILMASLEDEPQQGSNQTRHQVILTQGLWLADTARTQALWRAVLDEAPSNNLCDIAV